MRVWTIFGRPGWQTGDMETVISLVAPVVVLTVGILVTYRRPSARADFGTLQVTRRKRAWNEGALAEQAAERLRG
jgi:hypothetical protein